MLAEAPITADIVLIDRAGKILARAGEDQKESG